MNKLKDLFLLVVTFSIAIVLTVNLRTADSNASHTQSEQQVIVDVSAPPAPPVVDMEKDGWYWYLYKGTRGCLCTANQCLIAFNINDYYVTPWGKCYWHGDKGWWFTKADGPVGEELTPPTTVDLKAETQSDYFGVDISREYTSGVWRYSIEHFVPPGHRYHHEGHLYYNGHELPTPTRINDYYVTPWGRLYWVGMKRIRWEPNGWMRTPNPRSPMGRELTPLEIENYDLVD